MQALNAWLVGHDIGLLLEGPDPDSPEPLLHGIIARQVPEPGHWLPRWAVVTVWVRNLPGRGGVREPRHPYPPTRTATSEFAASGPAAEDRAWTTTPTSPLRLPVQITEPEPEPPK